MNLIDGNLTAQETVKQVSVTCIIECVIAVGMISKYNELEISYLQAVSKYTCNKDKCSGIRFFQMTLLIRYVTKN